jgi:hypothetical protein
MAAYDVALHHVTDIVKRSRTGHSRWRFEKHVVVSVKTIVVTDIALRFGSGYPGVVIGFGIICSTFIKRLPEYF